MNNKPLAILLDLSSVCVERGVSSSHRMSSSTIIRLSRCPLQSLWKILSTTLECDFSRHKCETFNFASFFISSLCPKPWDDYLVQKMEWMLFSWLVYICFSTTPLIVHIFNLIPNSIIKQSCSWLLEISALLHYLTEFQWLGHCIVWPDFFQNIVQRCRLPPKRCPENLPYLRGNWSVAQPPHF